MYKIKLKNLYMGFPCGLVVENPSCNAREIGSIPGLGIDLVYSWSAPHSMARNTMKRLELSMVLKKDVMESS